MDVCFSNKARRVEPSVAAEFVNAGRLFVTDLFYFNKKLRCDCSVEEGVDAFIVPVCSCDISLESAEFVARALGICAEL